jgi:molybdopterin-guanine dinucleotide biosynthesis protein A
MTSPRLIGLILAGGRARRLGGQDKALLQLAGQPLLAHVIARLAPQVDSLALNSNADPALFKDFGLPVLADAIAGFRGPLAGVHAGLAAFPSDELVTVAVDLPFLPRDLVARLKQDWDGARCRYAVQDTSHAAAILWPAGMAPRLAAYLNTGGASLKDWLREAGEPVVFTPSRDSDLGFNLNTPADLERAARHPALLATGVDRKLY